MSMKNIVTLAALVAGVPFASVTVSTQEVLPNFTMGWQEGVARIFENDGVTTALNFRLPIEARVVKGAPFSADIVTESIQTLADGNRIVQRSSTRMYRDGEGRVRREEARGTESPFVSITDPVGGVSYSLDPVKRVARQAPYRAGFMTVQLEKAVHQLSMRVSTDAAEKLKVLAAPKQEIERKIEEGKIFRGSIERGVSEQVNVEQLPARNIEGVRAEGTRRTTTIAAGAIGNELPIEIVSEEWTSPDLNVLVMTERRDPRLGTSTYRLENIIRVEPDRYLFEVPSDYTLAPAGIINKTGPAEGRGGGPGPRK
jgi:hypothetical protein